MKVYRGLFIKKGEHPVWFSFLQVQLLKEWSLCFTNYFQERVKQVEPLWLWLEIRLRKGPQICKCSVVYLPCLVLNFGDRCYIPQDLTCSAIKFQCQLQSKPHHRGCLKHFLTKALETVTNNQCMVYLPKFTIQISQLWVNIPDMHGMGVSITKKTNTYRSSQSWREQNIIQLCPAAVFHWKHLCKIRTNQCTINSLPSSLTPPQV